MKIEILGYDDLAEDERSKAANNGCGREMATYMRITYASGIVQTESDAMEPEDARFYRDLSWVKGAILRAYRQGMEDAKIGVQRQKSGACATRRRP